MNAETLCEDACMHACIFTEVLPWLFSKIQNGLDAEDESHVLYSLNSYPCGRACQSSWSMYRTPGHIEQLEQADRSAAMYASAKVQ